MKEWQAKLKAFEQDVQQLSEEKELTDRQLRQSQTERNDLQQENAILTREW